MKSILRRADFYISLFFLFCGLTMVHQTLPIKNPESRMLPFIVATVMILCAVLLFTSALYKKSADAKILLFTKREVVLAGMMFVTCFLMTTLGFYSALFLLLFSSLCYIDGRREMRNVVESLAYGVVFTGVLYGIFNVFLRIATPVGILI